MIKLVYAKDYFFNNQFRNIEIYYIQKLINESLISINKFILIDDDQKYNIWYGSDKLFTFLIFANQYNCEYLSSLWKQVGMLKDKYPVGIIQIDPYININEYTILQNEINKINSYSFLKELKMLT